MPALQHYSWPPWFALFLTVLFGPSVPGPAETLVSLLVQERDHPSNLVNNPGFEEGFDFWGPSDRRQVSIDPAFHHSGKLSARLNRFGEEPVPALSLKVDIKAERLYEFGFHYRTDELEVDPDIPFNGVVAELEYVSQSLRQLPDRRMRLSTCKPTSNWLKIKRVFWAQRPYSSLRLRISVPCRGGSAWIDDVWLREVNVPASEKRLKVQHGRFTFAETGECLGPGEMPEIGPDLKEAGMVPFVLLNPDQYRRRTIPGREDLRRSLQLVACPGEYEPAAFAIRTLKPLKQVRCALSSLKGPGDSRIAAKELDVRVVRFRLRLDDYRLRGRTFRNVPELLERFDTLNLPANTTQPFWITVHVPNGARPGIYQGRIRIRAEKKAIELPLKLKVRAFRLLEPRNITWALYVDSWRWEKRYRHDDELLGELRDIRAHGIHALLLDPEKSVDIRAGQVREWPTPALDRLLPLLSKAGMRGPIIMGLDFLAETAMGGKVRGPTGDEPDWSDWSWPLEAQKRYMDALSLLKQKLHRFPGVPSYFLGNEAFKKNRAAVSRAIWEYRLAREADMPTLFIGSPAMAREKLSAWLDIRCFDGGLAVNSGEQAAERFTECRDARQQFWWRGCGAFNLDGGNMVRNRYLAGLLHFKSAADGCVIWTFQRPVGSAFNDFDGIDLSTHSIKDACLTYPSQEKPENIPTPQWEGIREGIDDFRYAYTLDQELRKVIKNGKGPARVEAERIRKEFNQLLIDLPWAGERPFDEEITVPRLHAIREQVSKWIRKLHTQTEP